MAPSLNQYRQRSEDGYRVEVPVFVLVDDAALTETLGDGDLRRDPAEVFVDSERRQGNISDKDPVELM